MAISEFGAAINQVATERGIPLESVLESVKSALATAYKKDRKENNDEDIDLEEITVDLDSGNGEVRILKDGRDVTPAGFGRIAAQTAKQVILQKIRETEKEVITSEFKSKIGTIISGNVFKLERGAVALDLGKTRTHGIMPPSEQIPTENYVIGKRLKVLVKDIREGPKGTEIIVSRADPDFVIKLFEQEVPEIASGVVVIEAIAREPGSRTKMAVSSKDDKIDPVGSCVGQKGVRVQSIISELYGEKIDIVPYSEKTERFIAASLSPAKVTAVKLEEEEKKAIVSVPEDQQSLAIGKEGQNARLANKLTDWKIDIKGVQGVFGGENMLSGEEELDEKRVVGVWDDAIKKVSEELEKEIKEEEEQELKENEEAASVDEQEDSSTASEPEDVEDQDEEKEISKDDSDTAEE